MLPTGHIRGLDGLRALAILWVILWHTETSMGFPESQLGPFLPLVMGGWAGVDLFFALSGFLITSRLRDEEASREAAGGARRFDLARFYLRRALRILPIFYFVFLLNFLVFGRIFFCRSTLLPAHLAEVPKLAPIAFATFWGNYYMSYFPDVRPGTAFQVYWSLCVEEHFYLLWPLALVLVRSLRRRLLLAVLVCLAMLALRAVVRAWDLEPEMTVHFASHYRMDSILIGAAVALGFRQLAAAPRLRRAALAASTVAVVVLMLTAQLSVLPPPTVLGASLGYSLLALSAALLVAEVAASPSGPLVRLLEARPLAAIGGVSYGMYLIHLQMIDFARRLISFFTLTPSLERSWTCYLLSVALSFAIASLLYRLIERPFLRWKVRLGSGYR